MGDAAILALVGSPAASLTLEGGLRLVENHLEPGMDLAELDRKLGGKVGDGLVASHMPVDDRSLLLRGKRSLGNGTQGNHLRLG